MADGQRAVVGSDVVVARGADHATTGLFDHREGHTVGGVKGGLDVTLGGGNVAGHRRPSECLRVVHCGSEGGRVVGYQLAQQDSGAGERRGGVPGHAGTVAAVEAVGETFSGGTRRGRPTKW